MTPHPTLAEPDETAHPASRALTDSPTRPPVVTDAPVAHTDSAEPTYQRFNLERLGLLLRFHRDGLTQTEIAQRLDCTQSAVSRALDRLGHDSTDLAKALFQTRSYDAARRVIKLTQSETEKIALDASKVVLSATGVTERVTATVNVGVQVVVGSPGPSHPVDHALPVLDAPVED